MRVFFQDFFSRLSKVATFSNTDNLGEALRLMESYHLAEIEQRYDAARQGAVRKAYDSQPLSQGCIDQTSPYGTHRGPWTGLVVGIGHQ
jgi:hypothetical protein